MDVPRKKAFEKYLVIILAKTANLLIIKTNR